MKQPKNKKQQSKYLSGGVSVTLTRDLAREDGRIFPAGTTMIVTQSFYQQLFDNGYLTEKKIKADEKEIKTD